MFVKKALLVIPALLMTSPLLFSCNKNDPNVTYLRVLNSEDYIADGLIEEFEQEQSLKTGKKVKVIYETFDTMENMFNTLKTGKTKYDLVCASDYMVQKLVNLDLLDPINYSNLPMYDTSVSPFIRKRLQEITWGEGGKYKLDDYCICYMWGTLGILYNPNYRLLMDRGLEPDQIIKKMKSYDVLWDTQFQKTISIKDSMRDTYAIGLIHSFKEELDKAKSEADRQKIFDYGGEDDPNAKEHIDVIKKDLLTLRDNIFGFEVDSGKEDMVTEKIGVDTAWSGDAVKAIKNAEEEKNLKLYYSVPEEGSNLWFDCWTVQKGANKELAYTFLDYLSTPKIAKQNIDVTVLKPDGEPRGIGYTSAIAGDIMFDYYNNLYKAGSGDESKEYNLNYFFNGTDEGDYVISANAKYVGRQLSAQFPTKEEADNLLVMKDYGNNNDLILKMWEEVKHEALPTWAIALFVVEIALIAAGISVIVVLRIKNKNQRKLRRLKTKS